ncbi:MAG: hypothetical protein KJ645_02270, partial [Planctomycetes bacterium]|nr:hypothetical protein [Planctomycetota bacterium]
MKTKAFLFIAGGLVVFLLGGLVMNQMVDAQAQWMATGHKFELWGGNPSDFAFDYFSNDQYVLFGFGAILKDGDPFLYGSLGATPSLSVHTSHGRPGRVSWGYMDITGHALGGVFVNSSYPHPTYEELSIEFWAYKTQSGYYKFLNA